MALDSPEGGAAGIIVSAAPSDLSPEGRQPAAIGPWRLALPRLRRHYVTVFFLSRLVLCVRVCLLAPVYSADIAGIGPNTNNITGTVSVNGTQQNIVSLSGVPIGPTWGAHYLLGADTNGRDLAVRLLYGGGTSLLIGVGATPGLLLLRTLR